MSSSRRAGRAPNPWWWGQAAAVALVVGVALATAGCSGLPKRRALFPLSGDQFSLLDPGPRPRVPASDNLVCPGPAADRFACFMRDLGARLDAAGATASVAILDSGGAVHSAVHAPRGAAAPTPNDRFAIGSVTKTVTAVAVMTLVDAGLLDLGRPVADYLPELAGDTLDVGDVTLDQLLSHTSGLAPENPAGGIDCHPEDDEPDGLAAHVARLAGRPLLSPPGAVHNYSNLGYLVIGAVIERVTRERFEDVVTSRVLAPAGLTTAGFVPDPAHDVPGFPVPGSAPAVLCRAVIPAGGLWASAPELLRLLRAVMAGDGSLLRPSSAAALFAPRAPTGTGPDDAYGYGVGTLPYAGVRLATHSGGMPQYASAWALVPDRHFGAVVLVNTGRGPAPAAVRAARVFLDLATPPPPAPRPADQWARFVGRYRDPAGALGALIISLEDGRLGIRFDDHEPAVGLPPVVTFSPPTGAEARYVVTPLGVAERVVPVSTK